MTTFTEIKGTFCGLIGRTYAHTYRQTDGRTFETGFIRLTLSNDLEDEIRSNILKFTDDTKIFRELKDNTDCGILHKLVTWSQKWHMEFNV